MNPLIPKLEQRYEASENRCDTLEQIQQTEMPMIKWA